ncbi:MAG: phosphopantetheine adenylyltransferase [Methanocalculus sp. MSAO_Arc1]|uniref:phosphopantetheine adenylyltransferase n=1 Tax=Methanocalculus TaxID=71151 RepID=UPI000FF75078|nr:MULTISPECIES: phosphopantetheine adenylyltransferase [unclassified Methanocalculus]MCP1663109.1 pantetheine-phosphate adenylyltransferase [Methanocalculus sp. AMF5]RQD81573.1 MAG: phosphopantetheine adenylyltransferase [Methanocalculus sp. MSAO_Arc1]
MNVMVGGTFDPFHVGHKVLLTRSFEIAGKGGFVTIGLTSDDFASAKTHPVRPFEDRLRELDAWISSAGFPAGHRIECLTDRFGSALTEDFEALVVSEETFPVAEEINRIRGRKGMKKVDIYQIHCIMADDGKIVSSTRICRGEIDLEGHPIE